jgi:hypothetical protein
MRPTKINRVLLVWTIGILLRVASSQAATQHEKAVYESPLNFGLDLQAYQVAYKKYAWNDSTQLDTTGYGFNLGFEWLPYHGSVGKAAISSGLGFSYITNVTVSTGGIANLYVVPIPLGLTYRADFIKNQILVPFITGGFELGLVSQTSKTGDGRDGIRVAKSFYYTGGVEFCLNAIDSISGRELDSRYGINGVYLVGMYSHSQPVSSSETINLSHDEFKVGLRFEI